MGSIERDALSRPPVRGGAFFVALGLLGILASASRCNAQAGLRQSLERLDRDQDGQLDTDEITPLARPYLSELAHKAGETIHLAQMEQGQVLFVDKHKTTDRFETLAQAGRVAPAHCTGVGKAILAFMSADRLERAMKHQTFMQYTPTTHPSQEGVMSEFEDIRRDGVAYDREEHEEGIISIAADVFEL